MGLPSCNLCNVYEITGGVTPIFGHPDQYSFVCVTNPLCNNLSIFLDRWVDVYDADMVYQGQGSIDYVSGDSDLGTFDVIISTHVAIEAGYFFTGCDGSSSSIIDSSSSLISSSSVSCMDCDSYSILNIIYASPYVWVYVDAGCNNLDTYITAGEDVILATSGGFEYHISVDSIMQTSPGIYVIRATDLSFPEESDFVSVYKNCAPEPAPSSCSCCELALTITNVSGNQVIQFRVDTSECAAAPWAPGAFETCLIGSYIKIYEPTYNVVVAKYLVTVVSPVAGTVYAVSAVKQEGGIAQSGYIMFKEDDCYSRSACDCCLEYEVSVAHSVFSGGVMLALNGFDCTGLESCENSWDLLDHNLDVISLAPVSYIGISEMWIDGQFYWHTEWNDADFDNWLSVRYIRQHGCVSSSSIPSSSCSGSASDVITGILKISSRTYQVPTSGCADATMRLYDLVNNVYVFDWITYVDHFSVLEDGIYRLEVKCGAQCPAYYLIVDMEDFNECYENLFRWIKCNAYNACNEGCDKTLKDQWIFMTGILDKYTAFFKTLQAYKMIIYGDGYTWMINDKEDAVDQIVLNYVAVSEILFRCGCDIDKLLNCR